MEGNNLIMGNEIGDNSQLTQQEYYDKDIITFEMVLANYFQWREVSGNREYSFEQVDRVYAGFVRTCLLALNYESILTVKEQEKVDSLMNVCMIEHGRRQSYRLFMTSNPDPTKSRNSKNESSKV